MEMYQNTPSVKTKSKQINEGKTTKDRNIGTNKETIKIKKNRNIIFYKSETVVVTETPRFKQTKKQTKSSN